MALKPKRAAKIRVALVEWDDAVADAGWTSRHDNERPDRCLSIGAVVAENEASITLAGSWGRDSDGAIQSNNRMTIPAGMIVRRRFVRLP